MVSRELFIECVELLEEQYALDVYNSKVLSDMYGVEGIKIENALYAPLVKLLRVWFPVTGKEAESGVIGKGGDIIYSCEIQRYCYNGAWDGVSDAGGLYDYLVNKTNLHSIEVSYEFVGGKSSQSGA